MLVCSFADKPKSPGNIEALAIVGNWKFYKSNNNNNMCRVSFIFYEYDPRVSNNGIMLGIWSILFTVVNKVLKPVQQFIDFPHSIIHTHHCCCHKPHCPFCCLHTGRLFIYFV
uniref:Uncharacterized protein n=1 Tax=Cacopsylla melanoneura TaxID=428564 RepID=A0A8D8LYB0_9HEMI